MTTDITTTDVFTLTGSGYGLQLVPEAETMKQDLLAAAAPITIVDSNDASGTAQHITRKLANMRNLVEKARKTIKEPVIALGKRIDADAAAFVDDLKAEEARINKLVGDHAQEMARLKRLAEDEERRAFEDARRAREAAQAAEDAAANTRSIKDRIAAAQAERERLAALSARMEMSSIVSDVRVADGVRFAIDFEVVDPMAVLAVLPGLCSVEVKRAATLAWAKEMLAADMQKDRQAEGDDGLRVAGLRIFKKPIVSSR